MDYICGILLTKKLKKKNLISKIILQYVLREQHELNFKRAICVF